MVTHLRSINPAWHTVISQTCTKLHCSLAWRQRHTHSNNYVHECSVTEWWLTVEPMICMLTWNQWCHIKVIYDRMTHCYNCLTVHKLPSGSKYHMHVLLLFTVTSNILTVRTHGSTGTRLLISKILVKLKQGQNTNGGFQYMWARRNLRLSTNNSQYLGNDSKQMHSFCYYRTLIGSVAYQIAPFLMTLSDLQGYLHIASLFKCDFSHSRTADKISTDIARHAVPLWQISLLTILINAFCLITCHQSQLPLYIRAS